MTVTIVGAGVIGCAIAYELTSRGAAVRVIDSRGVGRGATQASAGILAPHIEAHSGPLLDLALRSLHMFDDFVARLRADTRLPVEYRRVGTLQVALDPAGMERLHDASARLDAASVPHTLLDGAAARRAEPALSSCIVGGLFVPEHGYVTPDTLTHALADAASRRGAAFDSAHVETVRATSDGVDVVADGQRIRSDTAVVAAGSWSSAVEPSVGAVKPIRGQLLHLAAQGPIASCVLWAERCYIVPRLDGSVLVGATVEDVGFDERPTAAGVQRLLDAAIEIVPALAQATFLEVRVGLRPRTPSELPVIAMSPSMPRVYHATGHYRNGVLLAPLTARQVGEMIERSFTCRSRF